MLKRELESFCDRANICLKLKFLNFKNSSSSFQKFFVKLLLDSKNFAKIYCFRLDCAAIADVFRKSALT